MHSHRNRHGFANEQRFAFLKLNSDMPELPSRNAAVLQDTLADATYRGIKSNKDYNREAESIRLNWAITFVSATDRKCDA